MKTAQRYKLGPYKELKISEVDTVALLNCDVPHLLMRVGSECIRIGDGQCIPVESEFNFLRIVNPFHFDVEFSLGLDWPVSFGDANLVFIDRYHARDSAFTAILSNTGTSRLAIGLMPLRGRIVVECIEGSNDRAGAVVMFPAARIDFLSFKPAACMTDATVFRRMKDGLPDTNIAAVSGLYIDADITTWCTAAGYTGQFTQPTNSGTNGSRFFNIGTDTALFYTRGSNSSVHSSVIVHHLGANEEDFQ